MYPSPHLSLMLTQATPLRSRYRPAGTAVPETWREQIWPQSPGAPTQVEIGPPSPSHLPTWPTPSGLAPGC